MSKRLAFSLLLSGLLLALSSPASVQAQFSQPSSVISAGATDATGGAYRNRGTVGQAVIGPVSGAAYTAQQGFWYTIGSGGSGANLLANLKLFLEGPYTGSNAMASALNANGHLPTTSPYGTGESVPTTDTTPNNGIPDFFDNNPQLIDWIYLELRSGDPATPPMTVVDARSAFVTSNGSVVDLDGSSLTAFNGVSPGTYFVVVKHRNHLAAMTNAGLDFAAGTPAHDFTTALSQAYTGGGAAMKTLSGSPTRFGLFTADANGDGNVTALDFNQYNAQTTAGAVGYQSADFNLDRNVTALDFNQYNANTTAGASSQVPDPDP